MCNNRFTIYYYAKIDKSFNALVESETKSVGCPFSCKYTVEELQSTLSLAFWCLRCLYHTSLANLATITLAFCHTRYQLLSSSRMRPST